MTDPTILLLPSARLTVIVALLGLLALVGRAEGATPKQDERAASNRAAVERVGQLLVDNYVFPEVGQACADQLAVLLDRGQLVDEPDARSLSQALTREIQAISKDKHLRVHPRRPVADGDDEQAAAALALEEGRLGNFGFEQVLRLEGNVGLLDLRGFADPEGARTTAVAAMNFLSNCDALIIDLRRNGGGHPGMVQLISSWFFDEPTHLNSLYWRASGETEEYWTLAEAPGPSMADVPLFVLTSAQTFSAAEEFTYNLKTRGRATIIGETTGGGAHPGDSFAIDDALAMFIATGRAINPITGTNWEGTGVVPDVDVKADDAVNVAMKQAREAARARRERRQAG